VWFRSNCVVEAEKTVADDLDALHPANAIFVKPHLNSVRRTGWLILE